MRKEIPTPGSSGGEFIIPGITAEHNYEWHLSKYIFASKFVKDKKILDIACGSGYGSYLLSKSAKEVYGGDINKTAINFATSHYQHSNLVYKYMNAINLPFSNNSFDMIVSFETIEHVLNYRKFLNECKRILKPNGIFIGATVNHSVVDIRQGKLFWRNEMESIFHTKEFNTKELNNLLSEYFGDVEMYGELFYTRTYIIKKRILILLSKIISKIPYGNSIKKELLPKNKKEVISNMHCFDVSDKYKIELLRNNNSKYPSDNIWKAQKGELK